MEWRRKDLRKKSTKTENLLWQELRNNKLGYKFKRQYSITHFVVDFYCAKAKLAIEVDGLIHKTESNIKYDKYRTEYLLSLGTKEIRFNNEEIINNVDQVIDKIKMALPSPEIRRGTEGEVV